MNRKATLNDELRAINGPVMLEDGQSMARVDQKNDAWGWSIYRFDRSNLVQSSPFPTPESAREDLGEKLGGSEGKSWREDAFRQLEPGQPWLNQAVGDVKVSPHAVAIHAIHADRPALAQSAMAEMRDLNVRDGHRNTLLIHAAGQENPAYTKDLLANPDVNARLVNKTGWSAAHSAAALGDATRVQALTDRGGMPQLVDREKRSALSLLSEEKAATIITPTPVSTRNPARNPAIEPAKPSKTQDQDHTLSR